MSCNPTPGLLKVIFTSRSGLRKGKGCNNTVLTILKTVVLAAMLRASVRTAMTANPRLLPMARRLRRIFCNRVSTAKSPYEYSGSAVCKESYGSGQTTEISAALQEGKIPLEVNFKSSD